MREEARDVGGAMLAVGIDLQRVAVAVLGGALASRQHGAALAAIAPRDAAASTRSGCAVGDAVEHARRTSAALPSSTRMQCTPMRQHGATTAPMAC